MALDILWAKKDAPRESSILSQDLRTLYAGAQYVRKLHARAHLFLAQIYGHSMRELNLIAKYEKLNESARMLLRDLN